MTKEEILEMARQADVWVAGQPPYQTQLEKFAKLVAEKEREECAELAWIQLVKHSQPWNVRQDISNAIKARGQHD